MTENKAFRAVHKHFQRKRRAAIVGKMPIVGKDTPFKRKRIRPRFQHFDIVVRLYNRGVSSAQSLQHFTRYMTAVRAKAEYGVRSFKPVADALGSVMRSMKGYCVYSPDAALLADGKLGYIVIDPRNRIAQMIGYCARGKYWYIVVLDQRCKTGNVVAVLMRDENSGKLINGNAESIQPGADALCRDARVDQQRCLPVLYKRAVAC